MAGLSGFASHQCILELAANSGSSRMSQAPNLHIVTQLLNLISALNIHSNNLLLPTSHCVYNIKECYVQTRGGGGVLIYETDGDGRFLA